MHARHFIFVSAPCLQPKMQQCYIQNFVFKLFTADLKTILIGCPNIDELHLKFFDHETVIPHDLPGLENLKKIRMEGKMDHLFFDFVFQKVIYRPEHINDTLHNNFYLLFSF